jgi:hypothetical protein
MLREKLPLHVDEVKIYPDKMTLSTLQFTERLGYLQENAVEMITMGCYNTLWTLRTRLEELKASERDAQDEISLALARKWMGNQEWPEGPASQPQLEILRDSWRCTREVCPFFENDCKHGKERPEKE